jgi:phosphate transport system substrate-binding protein
LYKTIIMNFLKAISVVLLFAALLLVNCKTKNEHLTDKITIKGSETELFLIKRFAEAYKAQNNHVDINVTGGGSGAGIEALIRGQVDMANSSRLINEHEMNAFEQANEKWVQSIVAVDAIAIITNPKLYINSVSLYQLSAIYNGKITNWKQIGGRDMPIHLIGRRPGSGTHDFMKHRLNIAAYSESIMEYEKYEDILNEVKNDSCAIAYISAAFVKQNIPKSVMPVFVMNVFLDNKMDYSPFDEKAIYSGDYALIRPLFQYYKASSANTEMADFIRFELSNQGQSLLKLSGYYPINVYHKQINTHVSLAASF